MLWKMAFAMRSAYKLHRIHTDRSLQEHTSSWCFRDPQSKPFQASRQSNLIHNSQQPDRLVGKLLEKFMADYKSEKLTYDLLLRRSLRMALS